HLNNEIVEETRHELAVRAGVDPDAWAALWRGNIVDRMLGRLGGLDDEIRTMLRQLGCEPSLELLAELVEVEIARGPPAVTFQPEPRPLPAARRERGLKLGLISTASADAGATVTRIGLADYFDAMVLSCDLKVVKPAPSIYTETCARLDVTPAES